MGRGNPQRLTCKKRIKELKQKLSEDKKEPVLTAEERKTKKSQLRHYQQKRKRLKSSLAKA